MDTSSIYGGGGQDDALAAAVGFIQGTLFGTVGTVSAVIAVAWIGLTMLTGRIDLRRTRRAILGCFIIFGASTIAAGIQAAISVPWGGTSSELMGPPPRYPPISPQAGPGAYDPYAGAGLIPQK